MLWIVAAAAAASLSAGAAPSAAVAQARATVRILSGVRVKLDGSANRDSPPPHPAVVHTDGAARTARLIEFQ